MFNLCAQVCFNSTQHQVFAVSGSLKRRDTITSLNSSRVHAPSCPHGSVVASSPEILARVPRILLVLAAKTSHRPHGGDVHAVYDLFLGCLFEYDEYGMSKLTSTWKIS